MLVFIILPDQKRKEVTGKVLLIYPESIDKKTPFKSSIFKEVK